MEKKYSYKNLDPNFPFNIKYAVMNPGFNMGKQFHWHNYLEISYVKEGEGIYYIEDRKYTIKKGDIVIINNIEPHYMEVKPPQKMIQPVIMFDSNMICSSRENSFEYNYLSPFFNRNESFHNKIDSNTLAGRNIYALLEDLVFEYNKQAKGYQLMIKAKLLNIVTILYRNFISSLEISKETMLNRKRLKKIEKSIEYIDKNYHKDITLKKISEISYMNPSYFSTFFKETTHYTPFDYLNKVRIQKSIEMIRSTNKKISVIAFECGFNNISNFNRIFKKITDKTPSELR